MGFIELNRARNVRDLGDMTTVDGRKIGRGRLLRGDALNRLDEADIAALAELGLRTVVDFRGPLEVAEAGPDRLPAGVTTVAEPIAGGDIAGILAAFATRNSAQQRVALGDGKATALMLELNREFVGSSRYRAVFGRTLRLIADPARQPILYHCTAGKDRTGWMTAIVLTAVGVPYESVLADFLATNDYMWPAYRQWLDRLATADEPVDPDLVTPLLYQQPAYLEAAFEEVRIRYGSFAEFLGAGLGFTAADVGRLRATLLD